VALLNNKWFQPQFQGIGVSRAELVQSGLLTNPKLMFSARFPEGGGRSNLTFGLAQDLVEIWQLPLRKRIARDQLEQTVLTVVRSAVDLAARVKTAYYQLRVVQENEKVVAENVALLERSAHLAEGRFNAGESTILDLNLIRSNVLQGTISLESARRDAQVNAAAFEHLLGLGLNQAEVKLVDALPSAAEPVADDKTLVELALKTRLDVRAASLEIDTAAREIRRQRRGALPGVSVGLEAERTEMRAPRSLKPLATDFDFSNPSQALQDYALQQFEAHRDRELEKRQNIDLLLGPSVELTLPVFDQNRAQIAKARYQFAQKQKDYEELLLEVVQEVRQAAATVRASQELLRMSLQEAVPLAEKNVDTAQRMYEAGEETVLALLLAQQSLNQQQQAAIRVAGDYAVALADLEKAVGGTLTGVPEDGAAANGGKGAGG
ncbi:MAG: TolC family protein, partial [Candidatus Hydrogenedentes bacterium]|nr:TolC family protein [Candidatus Hydrogenedentota bacterium]